MPNGERWHARNIADIESKKLPLTFVPYKGFTGTTEDTLLSNFAITLKDQKLIQTENISPDYIQILKTKKIDNIVFDKIPINRAKEDEILFYLEKKYPNSIVKKIKPKEKYVDKRLVIKDSKSKIVYCYLEYSHIGIPGHFVIIPPN